MTLIERSRSGFQNEFEQRKLKEAYGIKQDFLLHFTKSTLSLVQAGALDKLSSNTNAAIKNLSCLQNNRPYTRIVPLPIMSQAFGINLAERDPQKNQSDFLNFLETGMKDILFNIAIKSLQTESALENSSQIQEITNIYKSLNMSDKRFCYKIEKIVELLKKDFLTTTIKEEKKPSPKSRKINPHRSRTTLIADSKAERKYQIQKATIKSIDPAIKEKTIHIKSILKGFGDVTLEEKKLIYENLAYAFRLSFEEIEKIAKDN